jgi:hypothetical protein
MYVDVPWFNEHGIPHTLWCVWCTRCEVCHGVATRAWVSIGIFEQWVILLPGAHYVVLVTNLIEPDLAVWYSAWHVSGNSQVLTLSIGCLYKVLFLSIKLKYCGLYAAPRCTKVQLGSCMLVLHQGTSGSSLKDIIFQGKPVLTKRSWIKCSTCEVPWLVHGCICFLKQNKVL